MRWGAVRPISGGDPTVVAVAATVVCVQGAG